MRPAHETLTTTQERTLNKITSLVKHMMTTKDEAEYFEASADVLKLVASAIKDASFAKDKSSAIAYGTQALEYSIDNLTDYIQEEQIISYDN